MLRRLAVAAVLIAAAMGCSASRTPSAVRPPPVSKPVTSTSMSSTLRVTVPPTVLGDVRVPNVLGDDYRDAQVRLATITPSSWVNVLYRLVHAAGARNGVVTAQSVPAGTVVAVGSAVTLTVSIGAAAVVGAKPCTPSALVAALGRGVSEATGQNTIDVAFVNSSASTCVLDGYPAPTVVDAAGSQLPFSISHAGDQMTTSAAPSPVYLAPGSAAWVRLNKYRCDITTTDTGTSIVFRLPAAPGTLVVHPVDWGFCHEAPSSIVAVSPFEPIELLLVASSFLPGVTFG